MLTLAEKGGAGAEVIRAAPGFRLVATMNPGARRTVSSSLLHMLPSTRLHCRAALRCRGSTTPHARSVVRLGRARGCTTHVCHSLSMDSDHGRR